jgi:hypothetical protein
MLTESNGAMRRSPASLKKVSVSHLKLSANYIRRHVENDAGDSQIDKTAMSFPIAFRKAIGPSRRHYLRPDTDF